MWGRRSAYIVHGQPPWDDEHTLDLPLRVAEPGDPTKLTHVRMLAGPGGQPAITDDAFLRYCNEGLVPELARLFVLPRHALHVARVSFPHPDGDELTARGAAAGRPLPPARLRRLPRPSQGPRAVR